VSIASAPTNHKPQTWWAVLLPINSRPSRQCRSTIFAATITVLNFRPRLLAWDIPPPHSNCASIAVDSNMAEFMFVNLNDPTQNKRREVRKLVRSHVSYMQHSQRRIELGQVEKQPKPRHTGSINGWAVLDDSRASHSSERKANATSGFDSRLVPERNLLLQHKSVLPGADPVRYPRQLYNKELVATVKNRRHPRRNQRQLKTSPTLPTPTPDDGANVCKDSPRAVSTPPTVKSETIVRSPKQVIIKREPEYEADHERDIVSQRSSRSLSSSSTSGRDRKSDQPLDSSLPPLYSSLEDPTDELRIQIELSRTSLPSIMVSSF
jgi:hypothetical protein